MVMFLIALGTGERHRLAHSNGRPAARRWSGAAPISLREIAGVMKKAARQRGTAVVHMQTIMDNTGCLQGSGGHPDFYLKWPNGGLDDSRVLVLNSGLGDRLRPRRRGAAFALFIGFGGIEVITIHWAN